MVFAGGENPRSCPEGWFKCDCTCTCIPPKEGDPDSEDPTWATCNGKNDCCGTTHGILSDNPYCADKNKPANYTAADEQNCSMTCPEGHVQCTDNLPLECISFADYCYGGIDAKSCSNGKQILCTPDMIGGKE